MKFEKGDVVMFTKEGQKRLLESYRLVRGCVVKQLGKTVYVNFEEVPGMIPITCVHVEDIEKA